MLGPFVSYSFQGACVVKEISCGFVDDGVVARGVRGCPITANDANADSVLISAILGLDRALHGNNHPTEAGESSCLTHEKLKARLFRLYLF